MVHSDMPANQRNFTSLVLCLLIASVTIATYWLSKNNDFVNFDDQVYLTHNNIVLKGLTLEGVRYAFTSVEVGNWHPITWISHMIDVEVFGMKAGGHHLVSVFIHALNGVLLFLVLRGVTGSLWTSAFVAAVFALHPLRVESVVWASERKDLLSAFFGFLSVIAYLRFTQAKSDKKPTKIMLGIAALLHAFSLMSKPMLVTLPCLLLLLDYWPLQRIRQFRKDGLGESFRSLFAEKIPFVLVSIGSCVVTMLVQSKAGAVATTQLFPMNVRINNAIVATVAYLQKLFWPDGLCPFYPYNMELPQSSVFIAGGLIVLVTVMCARLYRSYPFLGVGWLWYTGLLVPVIGLVQVGSQSMADRYTYLPTIGVVLGIAWAVRQATVKLRRTRVLLVIPAAILLGLLSKLSLNQVLLWRDSETLFYHSLSVTKKNAIAHESVALILADRGAIKQAAWHFSEAVRIWPNFSDAFSDFGLALSLQGKFQEALVYSKRAIELNPSSERMQYNLARLYARMGSNDLARIEFRQFLKAFPDSRPGTLSLAELLLATGEIKQAVGMLSDFSKKQPQSDEVLLALSHALLADNRADEAMVAVRGALSLNPKNANSHYQLGTLLLKADKPAEAVTELEVALKITPAIEHHLALAEAHSLLNNNARAIAHYEQSLNFNTDVPATLNNLAWLLATAPESNLRNGKRAVEMGEKAARLVEQKEPFILGTLAAAYAEAGQFDKAISTAEKAITLAAAANQKDVATRNSELLELYRSGKPYHEPSK